MSLQNIISIGLGFEQAQRENMALWCFVFGEEENNMIPVALSFYNLVPVHCVHGDLEDRRSHGFSCLGFGDARSRGAEILRGGEDIEVCR
jgi:hypothetical protein